MLFESTRILLRSIVQSMEKGDLATWDDHLESGIQCLYELHQMSRPASKAYKIDSKSQGGGPVSDRAIQAIPHVKVMVGAIRRRDQSAAVQAGMAAVGEMNGNPVPKPRPVEPPPVAVVAVVPPVPVLVVAPAAPVKRTPVVKAKKRPVVAVAKAKKSALKRRPARPIVAAKRKRLAKAAGR